MTSARLNTWRDGVFWFALLISVPPAWGEEAVPWYQIEVIVFSHNSPHADQSEHWSPKPGLPELAGSVELLSDVSTTLEEISLPAILASDAIATTDGTTAPMAFQSLDESELQLGEVELQLRRSSAYQPLLHSAWRQPGYTDEDTRSVHLHRVLPTGSEAAPEQATDSLLENGGGAGPSSTSPEAVFERWISSLSQASEVESDKPLLDGIVRLRRTRYLHLDIDFVYKRETAADEQLLEDQDVIDSIEQLETSAPAVDIFRLKESRRIRTKEIHYFDHPLFGVLVQVVRYRLPVIPETLPANP